MPVKRETSDSRTFERVHLTVDDLQVLLEKMCRAMPEIAPRYGDPWGTQSIKIRVGSTYVTYESMAELRRDTTLPDVVTDVTIASRLSYHDDRTYSIRFESSYNPELSARSHDEAWVLGQLHVIGDFLESRQVEPLPRETWSKRLRVAQLWLTGAGLMAVGMVWFALFRKWTINLLPLNLLVIATTCASVLCGVLGIRLNQPVPSFELIIRDQVERPGPFGESPIFFVFTAVTALVAIISLVVLIVAWLFPRVPH